MKLDVLDKGYVRYVDHMGSDLDPVNDARVSYDKESSEYSERDTKLLNFLGREGHTSPFRGSILKLEAYAPLMVCRQWYKYVIGSDIKDPFLAWNESSRRYITEDVELHFPSEWRSAPENSKQGSGGAMDDWDSTILSHELRSLYEYSIWLYESALKRDVAPEQARLFLPAYGLYVRFRWTASLQAVCHLLNQRLAHDAQWEFQQYAKAIHTIAKDKFPNSVDALVQL